MMKNNRKTDKSLSLQRHFMKSYRKNTLALFLCFTLSITLITALLILIHTNHKLENIRRQILHTDADCCIAEINSGKVQKLIADPDLKWYALEQAEYGLYQKNCQSIYLFRGDDNYITLTAKLQEGRLPQAENETAAERWTLLNMGIEPECGQEIEIYDESKKQAVLFQLVGILSDMAGNKKYGVRALYAPVKSGGEDSYTVYIRFQDGTDYDKKVTDICEKLNIKAGKVSRCPGREDLRELRLTDLKIISVLLLVNMVVFYGIYRITMISRTNQYGILRAIGMKRRQLQRVILSELYEIYLVSVPAGVISGVLIALFISALSGDSGGEMYLNNRKIFFSPVIPAFQIGVCLAVYALLTGFSAYWNVKKMMRLPVPELITGCGEKQQKRSITALCIPRWKIRDSYSKTDTLFYLGRKYIVKDKLTSVFVILTICVGVTLFTGLACQKKIAESFRDDTAEMNYLNGQYEMGAMSVDSALNGIDRDCVKDIASLPGVHAMKTQAGIPVRVIDDTPAERNDSYYDEINEAYLKMRGYPLAGFDGQNQIYKSVLYGYNQNALAELKKYVIAGDFDENGLKSDEIILSILRMDDTKQNEFPGNYKEGTPLMQYRPGDEIRVKYRRDFQTARQSYETLSDCPAEYGYKTYRVSAIVSFAYMYDSNHTVYPLLITSDEQVRDLCPESHIQRIYIDGGTSLTGKEQENLEKQLIRLGSRNKNIATRSLISEIQYNHMLYQKQMVYIMGISIISFLLVLINMVNNLNYRMQIRTREICMLRAIGMSVKMIRRMMIFENAILTSCGVMLAYLCSGPVQRYLYHQSDMKAFAHPYRFSYPAFVTISVLAILTGILIAAFLSGDWRTRRIMERMNQAE